MFDMGFTEMMLIGIVALIVIGPERLPGVARTAGKYVGRLKRFMTTVKADVEQELRADELREILSQQQKELDTLKDTISDAGKEIEKEADISKSWGEPSAAAAAVGKKADPDTAAGGAEQDDAATESPVDTPVESTAQAEPESPATATEKPAGKASS
jgi:sec-independent protein translocase protein TatB